MKVTTDWLRDFVRLTLPLSELSERLTMAGLEVEDVHELDFDLTRVVAARIVATSPHPSAEKLQICTVDAGACGRLQVVCGAPNARADMVAILALPGATIAAGRRIEQSAVRGVESMGMLCSAAELGLGEDSSGLLELPRTSTLGVAIGDLAALKDAVIELNVTPNRGDCLSQLGVAREVALLTGETCLVPTIAPVPAMSSQVFPVELLAGESCPRYVGRVIADVDASVATPLWMKERLRRCGVRSINVIVDITNYTMLALGQPMHAFDLARLHGGIKVRAAVTGENLHLLDGTTIELDPACLVIADHAAPVALAGVMGGRGTGVELATRNIFLESALFNPILLAGIARRFKLHTDAAHRFERGIDPTAQARAIEYATRLIVDLCGGQPGPTESAEITPALPVLPAIRFRPARVRRVLGTEIEARLMEQIFERLGAQVAANDLTWAVTPPPYRSDLRIEEDLIEELARITGYAALPATQPQAALSIARRASSVVDRSTVARIRASLVAGGFSEAITYSFISSELWRSFAREGLAPIELANPITADMRAMRASLWPGLLLAARYNLNRQATAVRLFEIGMVFEQNDQQLLQTNKVGGVVSGEFAPQQWDLKTRPVDFFDLKGDLTNLLKACGGNAEIEFAPAQHPALHPGATAEIRRDGHPFGILGSLHPKLCNSLEIEGNPILFEINLNALSSAETPRFVPLSKFPAVRRDLSIVVAEATPVAAVLAAARELAGEHLRDLQLFDVYRGQGIDSDKKSLALGLIFQASSSTLIDDQIDAVVAKIIDGLRNRLSGILRT